MKPAPHVASWKKEEVQQLVQIMQRYNVIGLVDMTNLPSFQLQKMRAALQKTGFIIMTKARLLNLAFAELNGKIQGIQALQKTMQGMPALICTNENPFSLAKTLRKAKSKAPAKPGQKAPNDLIVLAGPTPFAPGPIIGELGQLGIKTQIQEGKIHIKEEKIIAHEGDVISGPVASMLTRLGIEPMEIGLNLVAVLEKGMVFLKNVLDVDEKVYIDNLKLAAAHAFALAFSVAYPTKDNITMLVVKAARDAEALAEARKILTSKAAAHMINAASGVTKGVLEKIKGYTPDATPKQGEQPMKKEETPAQPTPEPQQAAKSQEEKFKEEEKIAQDVLKKLQDKKLKEAQKPRWAL